MITDRDPGDETQELELDTAAVPERELSDEPQPLGDGLRRWMGI